ncbi:MAG: glycoside hydrolase family 99-like domain-containing protein [Granulosicoccaceae bacterium]
MLSLPAKYGKSAKRFQKKCMRAIKRTVRPLTIRRDRELIAASGMFDPGWYKQTYKITGNAIRHYCQVGYSEGKQPNSVVNMHWYFNSYPEVRNYAGNPLVHYIRFGEAKNLMPSEFFDPQWYRNEYQLENYDGSMLKHYLHIGRVEGKNPNRLFNCNWYLTRYKDVRMAGIDAVDHFYLTGWRELRKPSMDFETQTYVEQYMGGAAKSNPVTHALSNASFLRENFGVGGGDTAVEGAVSHAPRDMADNIKYFANPGPDFQLAETNGQVGLAARAKTIAFYLPQFHAFAENDRWWGDGFSEWRNVSRGAPRFDGHYQPRIPRDLGYYDLNDGNVLKRQSELALQNGIEAFCFYYYWFDGKRLMDMPLDKFASADLDQEFCIMWANENWTRTWDGFDSEVLIEQSYDDADEDDFIEDTARYFRNDRYMRVNGRPLFILYRPGLIPQAKKTFARWRRKWKDAVGVEPYFLMVQGFGDEDPQPYGLDGAVEFPPHKLCQNMRQIQSELTLIDQSYSGIVHSYNDVIERSLNETPPAFPLIKTVVPHWDNDARREGRGMTLHGSTPDRYGQWLDGAIEYANENPFNDTPMVFINAWNEWAEGAYIEPDVHYGHAYLNATRRAVYGLERNAKKLLLVGHDANRHGAQMLLKSMAEVMTRQFGLDVTILVKDGGSMMSTYKSICTTVLMSEIEGGFRHWALKNKFDTAICNTTVTGDLVPALSDCGIKVVSLIHELPNLIREYELQGNIDNIAGHADHVLFPSEIVERGFASFTDVEVAERHIRPQGTYKEIVFDAESRSELRTELGVLDTDKLVINVGYADLRKGFDLFLQVAMQMVDRRDDIHFAWAGQLAPEMERWVASSIVGTAYQDRIHLVGFTDRMADYYSACDCLYLSSREDPYPTVVLEAMNVGVPVVLYSNTTGFDELLERYGYTCALGNASEAAASIEMALNETGESVKQDRIDYIEENCQFDDYCFELLQFLSPSLKKVSVVVPNYNYAEYMPKRLLDVFSQGHPVFEVIVLDDCSNDESLSVIVNTAKELGRDIRLLVSEKNSGNVFLQWRKGAELSRGTHLWIAEADDESSDAFLRSSLEAFDDDTALCFCDSKQIDAHDKITAESYDYYYKTIDGSLFNHSFNMAGPEFIQKAMSVKNVILNVSSVVWRQDALLSALDSVQDELPEHKLVGDWRLYLELLAVKNNKVAYLTQSLNVHRRHESSVTAALDKQRHLDEITAMHAVVKKINLAGKAEIAEMDQYIEELRVQFELDDSSTKAAA